LAQATLGLRLARTYPPLPSGDKKATESSK
jgi:hypothetical protein